MPWQPSMIELGKCDFMTRKGAMTMSTIVIRLINLSVNKACKVLNRLLPAVVRHYKNKRPPPSSGELLNTSITIWITHDNTSFY